MLNLVLSLVLGGSWDDKEDLAVEKGIFRTSNEIYYSPEMKYTIPLYKTLLEYKNSILAD